MSMVWNRREQPGLRGVGVKVHHLKTSPEPFAALLDGTKTAEFRRDDRGFAVGDALVLEEWVPAEVGQVRTVPARYTGRNLSRRVTHIVRGPDFGVPDGFVVLSLGPVST